MGSRVGFKNFRGVIASPLDEGGLVTVCQINYG